jgi:hypothetical protein
MNARWLRLLCAGALALSSLTSLPAHAQYSWIDDKGSRVFSDRPPPPGTPPSRILKTPGGVAPAAALPVAGAEAVPDWKLREEDYKKRSEVRAKEEETERVAAARRRSEHSAECEWARSAMVQLDRRRLEWTNKQGKREFMSEEDRNSERQRAQKILQSCA